MGKKEDFEMDVLRDRKPIELPENWDDVVMQAGVGEQVRGRVLYELEFVEHFG